MLKELMEPEILELIEQKKWKTIKNILLDWPAQDISDLLSKISEIDMIMVFRLLPTTLAADVFIELDIEKQEDLLNQMTGKQMEEFLLELSPDERTELFEELPGKLTQTLLNILPADELKKARELLGYPENSVGRLMTPDYVAVQPDWTVGESLKHIRKFGKDAETINMVYVVDKAFRLIDDVPIRRFILADVDEKVENLTDQKMQSVYADTDQEIAARMMEKYDLNVMPVVSSDNVILGIITIDDVIDVIEEEATEDFHKGAAVAPLEINYSIASPIKLYLKRVGWLMLLLIADFLSSNVIAFYEDALTSVIALAFFIPVLIDSGGNTATQSATLIIRAISMGEINFKKWFHIVRKELITGLLLGVSLAAIVFLRSYIWGRGFDVSIIVAASLLIIVVWANILGSILPLILTKLKLDPAVVSSPLLTTVLDATGLIIYFSIARYVLKL